MGKLQPPFEERLCLGEVAFLKDLDFDDLDAPRVHGFDARLINVDGSGSDEGAPVVIDDINGRLTFDAKLGPERELGPVGRGGAVFAAEAEG